MGPETKASHHIENLESVSMQVKEARTLEEPAPARTIFGQMNVLCEEIGRAVYHRPSSLEGSIHKDSEA